MVCCTYLCIPIYGSRPLLHNYFHFYEKQSPTTPPVYFLSDIFLTLVKEGFVKAYKFCTSNDWQRAITKRNEIFVFVHRYFWWLLTQNFQGLFETVNRVEFPSTISSNGQGTVIWPQVTSFKVHCVWIILVELPLDHVRP